MYQDVNVSGVMVEHLYSVHYLYNVNINSLALLLSGYQP